LAYRRKATVGAWTKCTGKVLFYSRALHGGNAAYAEGEQEVTAWRGGRAGVLARTTRRSGDVTVAAPCMEATRRAFVHTPLARR
jgi:hypothetical protein